jgi:hypothetical protein
MTIGLVGGIAAETILLRTDRTNGMVGVRGHDLPPSVARHGVEDTARKTSGRAGCRSNLSRGRMASRHTDPGSTPSGQAA